MQGVTIKGTVAKDFYASFYNLIIPLMTAQFTNLQPLSRVRFSAPFFNMVVFCDRLPCVQKSSFKSMNLKVGDKRHSEIRKSGFSGNESEVKWSEISCKCSLKFRV